MEEPAGFLKLAGLPPFSFLPSARSTLHFLLSTAPASGTGSKSTSKARVLFVPGNFIRLQIAGWPTQPCHSSAFPRRRRRPGKFENVPWGAVDVNRQVTLWCVPDVILAATKRTVTGSSKFPTPGRGEVHSCQLSKRGRCRSRPASSLTRRRSPSSGLTSLRGCCRSTCC